MLVWIVYIGVFILLNDFFGNGAIALFWTVFVLFFHWSLKMLLANRNIFSMLLILLGISWLFREDDD